MTVVFGTFFVFDIFVFGTFAALDFDCIISKTAFAVGVTLVFALSLPSLPFLKVVLVLQQ